MFEKRLVCFICFSNYVSDLCMTSTYKSSFLPEIWIRGSLIVISLYRSDNSYTGFKNKQLLLPMSRKCAAICFVTTTCRNSIWNISYVWSSIGIQYYTASRILVTSVERRLHRLKLLTSVVKSVIYIEWSILGAPQSRAAIPSNAHEVVFKQDSPLI